MLPLLTHLRLLVTILLIVVYDLQKTLDVVNQLQAILRNSHLKCTELFLYQLGYLEGFDVLYLGVFVVAEHCFFSFPKLPGKLILKLIQTS